MSAGLDVLKAVQGYINKIITATPGIKVLLLDGETVSKSLWHTGGGGGAHES